MHLLSDPAMQSLGIYSADIFAQVQNYVYINIPSQHVVNSKKQKQNPKTIQISNNEEMME